MWSGWRTVRIAVRVLAERSILALAATIAFAGQSFGGTAESTKSDVERLVAAAAQAEVRGDVSKSRELLQRDYSD